MKSKLLLLILMLPMVVAEQVLIVNFHYDNGVLSINDQIVKDGFHPDRLIQPNDAYNIELISLADNILYSTNFKIPNELITEGTVNGELQGDIIVLSKTDFALVLPNYPDIKEIKITNPRGFTVLQETVAQEQFFKEENRFWVVLVAAFIVGIVTYLISHKTKDL